MSIPNFPYQYQLHASLDDELNWAHPITKGLILAMPLNGSNSDLVRGASFSLGAQGAWAASTQGMSLYSSALTNTSIATGVPIPAMASTNRVSASWWMNWETYSPQNDNLAMEFTANSNTNFGFFVDMNSSSPANLIFVQFLQGPSGGVNSWTITRPTAGVWHHFAFSYDGSAATRVFHFYIDGKEVTATSFSQVGTQTGNFANDSLYIMSRNNTSLVGQGRMNKLYMWNRPITAQEVTQLYYTPYIVHTPYMPIRGNTPASVALPTFGWGQQIFRIQRAPWR